MMEVDSNTLRPEIPLLAVFADGIGHDSLEHMPFLSSLHCGSVLPVLGYSVTCHASMYTGVYPEDHGLFFIWERNRASSPFRRVGALQGIPGLDNKYVKYAITRFFNRRSGYRGYFGIPRIEHLPYKYWPEFDVTEKKFWSDEGYLAPLRSIFDLARGAGVRSAIIGMDKRLARESHFVASQSLSKDTDWNYLFIGDLDFYTHRHTKESSFVRAQLRRIDDILQVKYREMEKLHGDFHFLMWSDHGHVSVRERVDLYELFRSFGRDLNDYLHAIEATVARFWFRDDGERAVVSRILSAIDVGSTIDADAAARYRVRGLEERFGDLLFLLDAGAVFDKTIWGDTTWVKSMHGYAPDAEGYAAALVTNFETTTAAATAAPPDLTHVFSTLADLLGLKTPDYVSADSLRADSGVERRSATTLR
jgi:predicted AlkP superfamily pyrophosphatase or phosphodiesterase